MNTSEYKILLVEDDEALRFIVKDNLEQYNYAVEVAENGETALDLFAKNPESSTAAPRIPSSRKYRKISRLSSSAGTISTASSPLTPSI